MGSCSSSSSTSSSVVLLTGSTGNTGSSTIQHLNKLLSSGKFNNNNLTIRGGVRDEKKASEKFNSLKWPSNTKFEYTNTTAPNDSKKPTDNIKSALNGVSTLAIFPPGEGRVETSLAFIESAKLNNIKHIILLSVATAGIDSITFGRQWKEIESAVIQSKIPYTFVRAPFFLENQYGNVGSIKNQSAFYYPVKPESEHVLISVSDIGEAVANIILNPSTHLNKTYTLTTSEAISNLQVAKIYSELLNKQVNFIQVPDSAALEAMVGMGYPKWQAQGVVELWNSVDNKDSVAIKPTNDFKTITGKDPISQKQFITNIIAAFK